MTAATRWRTLLTLGLLTTAFGGLPATAKDQADDAALTEYLSGNGLLNRGLYDLAAAEYRKFLAKHPMHDKASVARYGLAVCLQRSGQHDEAVAELTKLSDLRAPQFPYSVEVMVLLGQSHMAQGCHDRAVPQFVGVTTKHADHDLADDAAAGQAECEYRLRRFEAAVATTRLVQQRWPDSPLRERTDFLEALALSGAGQVDQAAPRFEAYLQRFSGGTFEAQARLQLGRCRRDLGERAAAIAAYEPLTRNADATLRRAALLEIAIVLLDEGRADEARQMLERLIDDAELPANQRLAARFELGRCHFASESFEPAEAEMRVVMGSEDERADQAAYLIGKCLLRRERHAEAARHLQQARQAFADSELLPRMHYDHAVALLRAEDSQADAVLQAFVESYPHDPLAAEALRVLATNAHGREDYAASQRFCRRYLQDFSEQPEAAEMMFLEAENDYLSGEYAAAAEGYERYLAGSPSASDARRARFRLGMACYRLQDHDRAGPFLLEVTRGPEVPAAYSTAQLALGDIYFQRELWADAEAALSAYLQGEADPQAADDCLIKITLAQQRQQRLDEALHTARQLVETHPQSPHVTQAVFEQGQILVELQRPQEARKAFERVVRQAPDSRFATHSMRHLAVLAMQRDDYRMAADLLDRVERAEADPADQRAARFRRGLALLAAGDFEQAEAVLLSFTEAYPSDARAAEARARRAIALSRLQRWAEALEIIAKVERAGLEAELSASLAYEKAWCLRRLGREADAATAYRHLVERAPSGKLGVHATLELAELEYKSKRYGESAELLRSILAVAPPRSGGVPGVVQEQSLYLLGMCEFQQDNHAQAAQLLERFMKDFDSSAQISSALYFAGEAQFSTRQFARAAPHYERLINEHPSDPACEPALLRLGECFAELQRYDDSVRTYARYLRDFPGGTHAFQAHFGIGWARENLGRHEEALDTYRKVVAAHKGVTAARAQFQIGECLFALDRHQEAVTEFLKVDILYDYPERSAAALYEAGRCFEHMAQGPLAREHYQQVVQKFEQTRWAQMASQRLEGMPRNTVPGHE